MARYCVYCYNGIHNIYYHRKSKDFILTKDYRRCAKCGKLRRLVIIRLFAHFDYQSAIYYRRDMVNSHLLMSELFFYLPIRVVLWIYRRIKNDKKAYKRNLHLIKEEDEAE